MRSPRALIAVLAAAALAAAITAASTSSSGSLDASFCLNRAEVVLTTCGSSCKATGGVCAQYPSTAGVECSEEANNICQQLTEECTYQCILPYDSQRGIWVFFAKTPDDADSFNGNTSLPFPAAPISRVEKYRFPADSTSIQFSGLDAVDVPKGATADVTLENTIFDDALRVETLTLSGLDLSKLSTNFLPKSVSTLLMQNCRLSDVPVDVGNMGNIKTLNISKNSIAELPSADSKIVKTLQGLTTLSLRDNELTAFNWVLPSLTTLDLSSNKLTTFPTSIFNMTRLESLYLNGNPIPSLTLTATQLSFLKRLNADSTLGIKTPAGSCVDGQTEEKLLDSIVCASTAATPAPNAGDGNSSTVIIIVAAVVGGLLVVGAIAVVWRRRSQKQSAFYVSVMENNNNSTPNTTGGEHSGPSRGSFFNRGRAPSAGTRSSVQSNGGGGRPSRATSNASRPSNNLGGRKPGVSVGSYAELGRVQDESAALSLAVGGSRQRESAKINQNVVRLASHDIRYTRTIAKGAYGEVWLAHYGRDLVAVKKLLATSDPTSVGDFVAELNLLSSLSHPRVLALVGACWEDDLSDVQIVMEFMDAGDLLTVLRRSSPSELTWERAKATYCLHVCEAVYYLHSLQPALIHRDIKSRNILVDDRKGAKLSDFGESRERTIQNTMTAGVGTARWVAPEIILGENYSELADIYSLGVLLTELDTHQIPFETLGLEEHMIVTQVAVGKLRPKVSESCPEIIRRLAHECLQFDPQLRPTAARVLQTLMASPLIRRLSTISDSE